MNALVEWLFNLIQSFAGFGNWLVSPTLIGGMSPLGLITGTGLLVILGIWVFKFLNPLN